MSLPLPAADRTPARLDPRAAARTATRSEVAEFVLDLSGYRPGRDLAALRLLDPACGEGVFVVHAAERLLASARRTGTAVASLSDAIRAYELEPTRAFSARACVAARLFALGVPEADALRLANAWIRVGDFLLAPALPRFDVVVGNPPYLRLDRVERTARALYRRRYRSLYARADLYVAFLERGLSLLSPTGTLGVLCADRWARNAYGAPLRRMVADRASLRCWLELHAASPFEREVTAYPAISVFSRIPPASALAGRLAELSAETRSAVVAALDTDAPPPAGVGRIAPELRRDGPWMLEAGEGARVLAELEARFDPLEAGGAARVRTGLATGCDEVFIVGPDAEVEADRLIPFVTVPDVCGGRVGMPARFVLDTWAGKGRDIAPGRFPRLDAYLRAHEARLRRRYLVRRTPERWFRTIDRADPALTARRKLVIPEIGGALRPALEEGRGYPHHGLYFVTSEAWDEELLAALLSSRVAAFFIWSYGIKMRGGWMRFQAQFLRLLRVPRPASLAGTLADDLRAAWARDDFDALDDLACRAWRLDRLPDFPWVDTRRRG